MDNIITNDLKRFSSKYDVGGDGCWLWRGSTSDNGYGNFYTNAGCIRAHRFSYEVYKGKIPPRLVIDHLCRNRACVNPDHLEAVTSYQNIMRGKGRAVINKSKTHCRNGHEFTPATSFLRVYSHNGRHWRVCRICHNARQIKYSANRKRKATHNHI